MVLIFFNGCWCLNIDCSVQLPILFDLVVSLLELLVVIQMFTETLVSPALGRELTCLLNDAHPGKYSGIRPKSIYSGESTLVAVGETFEGEGEAFLEIHPCLS